MMTALFSKTMTGLAAAVALGLFMTAPASAGDIDWDNVEGKEIVLFYPGQGSWEWALTQSDHSGAKKFRQGKNCAECHEGEEADMGNLIVSGKKLEPQPIERKRGFIPVNVKVAHDGENFYMRLEWTEQGMNGFPSMDPDFETKVTVMFDDGTVSEARRAGCWGTCHDDATGMASNAGPELPKYLSKSRAKNTRQGGGKNYKSDSEIASLEAAGTFLEYWQARLNHDQAPVAVDGHILKSREENKSPAVSVSSHYTHGTWVVVFSRPMTVDGDYRKAIKEGVTYTFGIAIHEAHAAKRFHHVSFENTFVLDSGDADLVAPRR